jgi:hypothetical protein
MLCGWTNRGFVAIVHAGCVTMSGFFEEVQRRKVYRVAAAYIIVAAGVIQLASAAFSAWELPNWG